MAKQHTFAERFFGSIGATDDAFDLDHAFEIDRTRYLRHFVHRALLAAAIAWLPLCVLALIQDALGLAPGLAALLADIGANTRALVTVPVLIVAEGVCAPRLSAIANHFLQAGFVTDLDRDRYQSLMRSTRLILGSPVAKLLIVSAAYVCTALIVRATTREEIPPWHKRADTSEPSLAGLWHMLVTMPMVLALLLGWALRVLLWARFLRGVASLPLRLSPPHPDLCAGLGFVGRSALAFGLVAFGFSSLVSSRVAMLVTRSGAWSFHHTLVVISTVLLALLAFCGPLWFFARPLLCALRRGVFDYGELSDRVTRELEQKWMHRRTLSGPLVHASEPPLGAPDFSSLTDLNSSVANVYAMRPFPIDKRSLLGIVGFSIAPFTPIVFLVISFEMFFETLTKMLL